MLEEVTYKYLLAIIMSMILLIRLYFRFKFYHKTQKTSSSFKTREMIIAGSIGLSFSIPVLLYWFTNRIDFSELNLTINYRICGFIFLLINTLFLGWIHYTLGKNWSPILEIHKEQTLIIVGPYKYVRHPMYTCLLFYSFGLPLLTSNWLLGMLPFITFLGVYYIRIPSEEKMMQNLFGKQYDDYSKKTNRIIPFFF